MEKRQIAYLTLVGCLILLIALVLGGGIYQAVGVGQGSCYVVNRFTGKAYICSPSGKYPIVNHKITLAEQTEINLEESRKKRGIPPEIRQGMSPGQRALAIFQAGLDESEAPEPTREDYESAGLEPPEEE